MKRIWPGLLTISLGTIFGLAVFNQLPQRVPIHWGITGEIDGYADRGFAVVLLPIVALIVLLLLGNIQRLDPIQRNYPAIQPTINRYGLLISLFLMLLHVIILLSAMGMELNMLRLILAGTGALFVLLGNELGRLRPNSLAGIRVPWTLTDEDVWRQSHRVGGRIMVASGLGMMVCVLLLPPNIMVMCVIAIIAAMVVGMFGYSYYVAMRKRRGIA